METDIGILGVCVALVGCLTWIAKRLLTALTNDLAHIKDAISKLPCDKHARQLGRHEEALKSGDE